MSSPGSGDHFDHEQRPSTNRPLNGERRPVWKPVIITAAVFAVLVVLYLLGTQLLVDAG